MISVEFINVYIGEDKFVAVANEPSVLPLVKQIEAMKVCGICANSDIPSEPSAPGVLVCVLNLERPCEVKKMGSCLDWDLEVSNERR